MTRDTGTRAALAWLAGESSESVVGWASSVGDADGSSGVDVPGDTDVPNDAGVSSGVGERESAHGSSGDPASGQPGVSDATTEASGVVAAGAAAVRRGDTAGLVAAAERASDDLRVARAFAEAGGYAHLAGALAYADDPRGAARGAVTLVTLAAFRRARAGAEFGSADEECGVAGAARTTRETDRRSTRMGVEPVGRDE